MDIDAKREVANAPAAIRAAEVRRDAALDANADLRAQQAEVTAAQQSLNRTQGALQLVAAGISYQLRESLDFNVQLCVPPF